MRANEGSAADAGFSHAVSLDQRPGPADFVRYAGSLMRIDSRAKTQPRWLKEGIRFVLLLLLLASSWAEAQELEFTYATNNGTITIEFYSGQGGNVSIPETINGLPVTAIADNMIWGWFPLDAPSAVIIPKSVTTIGPYVFRGFRGLTSITIDPGNPVYSDLDGVLFDKLQTTLFRFPSGKSGQYQIPTSVTNIGPVAFLDCSGLSSLIMSDQIVTIENGSSGVGAFSGSGLTNITVPPLITALPDYAFAGCGSLRQVILTPRLQSIGWGAFWYCGDLNDIILPESLTNIGPFAFISCTSLKSLTIPARISSIGTRALASCSSLGAINVDPSNAFYSSIDGVLFDKALTTLVQYPGGRVGDYTIPNGITNIPSQAFYNCSNLTGITIPTTVVNIEANSFYGCVSLKSVSLPEGITQIQYATFDTCSSLTNVNIPNSVTKIGQKAFDFCTGLVSVTIPSSVVEIGALAFYACDNLQSVYFQGNAPLLDSPFEMFSDARNATIYYQPGTQGWGLTLDGRPAALWNPVAQSRNASFGVLQNRFGFNITGTANIPLVVEASTNLAFQSWVPLQSCTLTNGLIYFSDPQWTNYPSRFYRIRSP